MPAPLSFLIVDDEPSLCDLFAAIVNRTLASQENLDVQTATSFSRAVELLGRLASRDGRLVVVSDFQLGAGPTGGDLLEIVRRVRPDAQRFLVSASPVEELAARGAPIEALDGVIAKPVRVADFSDVVRRAAREDSPRSP